jgi:hypothetical protein
VQQGFEGDQEDEWRKLIAALAANGVAISGTLPDGDSVQGALTPEMTRRLAASPHPWKGLRLPSGQFAWIPSSTGLAEDDEPARRWYARCRAAAEGAPPGQVQVRITVGQAREEHWLEVVAVKHQGWGNYTIDARLSRASVLNSLLGAGTLLRLSPYEIRDWSD